MADRTELTTVETVHEEGSWLFTIWDRYGNQDEVILVPCEDGIEQNSTGSRSVTDDGVEAWINRCTHEAQRFDTGRGVAMRDGRIICQKHGSMFDACTGYCDSGEAADTTLPSIDIAIEDGTVYLTDDEVSFAHAGGIGANDDDDDDGPSSTSHLSF